MKNTGVQVSRPETTTFPSVMAIAKCRKLWLFHSLASTVPSEGRLSSMEIGEDTPWRNGSRTVHFINRASRMPGSPAAMNAMRQP
jgi:hypothetical protein